MWPGSTAWPDFTHPNASSYWANQISQFQSEVAFDGLWIDMNEPSDFVDGSNYGCPPSQLEHPPYLPRESPGLDWVQLNLVPRLVVDSSPQTYRL